MSEFQAQETQEVLHGCLISDPYRWLEERASPRTASWLEMQRQKADRYFEACEGVDELRMQVRALLDRDEVTQPVRVDHRLFFRRRNTNQEQGCICVSHLDTGTVKILVDPPEEDPLSSAHIHGLTVDGSLLAFAVAHGGPDTREIRFVDTDRGQILSDRLPSGRHRGLSFFLDQKGFYYSHDKADVQWSKTHSIRSHPFGMKEQEEREIFSAPRSGLSKLILLADEVHLGALYVHVVNRVPKSDLYLTPRDCDTGWTLFAGGLPGSTSVTLRHGEVFLCRVNENYKRFLEGFTPGREGARTIIPAAGESLLDISIRKHCIYSRHFDGFESRLHVWGLDGRHLGTVDAPPRGTIQMCPTFGSTTDTLFYTYESFDSPPQIFRFDPDTWKSRPCFEASSANETRHCLSVRTSYPTKDGVDIPITLVTDRRFPKLHDRFTLMTSYGGFGVSMTPQFSVLATVMLELGAILVVPHIRGGGEGGTSWHQAAVGVNRQTAFDDFIGAAEWLCREGITSPSKLAIFGGSNSGLLVAAVNTQRPDLFRAVLCIAGLLDMVRYEQFDRSARWRSEFGSVANEAEFHALRSYSPYHRVTEFTDYPAALFVSGDQDDRCNPAHSRKMTARLQQRKAQRNPIVLDYTAYRGHSPLLPLSIRVEALTFRLAFLCRELGIDIPRSLNRVASTS